MQRELSSLLHGARGGPLPLSFAQDRLWFLEQLEPGSSVYNISRVLRLRGTLKVEALQKALDAILTRHQVLRTVFVSTEGNPLQVIRESVAIDLPVVDLGTYSEQTREEEVLHLARAEAQRPFDLSKDLMLRALVIRLEREEHVLVLVMHHIASDGWSVAVLFEELSLFYEAFHTGKSVGLPRLPIQYADYAVWQREWLGGEKLEEQVAYWKQQMEGAPQVLELPSDRPRSPVQTFRGARQSLTLAPALSEELRRLSRAEGVSLFMTLLAAFKTLLYRYTGQKELLVGTPIAGRNQAETDRLIGFFVNTLVLRSDLSGDPTFRELLRRVRTMCLDAYAHQDLPFEKLVKELQLERDMSRNPLFQVMFTLHNTPLPKLNLLGIDITAFQVDNGTAKFDLTLAMVDKQGQLTAWFEYNTDLFDASTIERMQGHYETLLADIVAKPEQRISSLTLLTETERRQLLVEWNATATDYPKRKCLHELFEGQVKRSPEAVAVLFEDQPLTYLELNRRANRLAHYLMRRGVGPETLVGILVERSMEMVIAVLGILKAGGAYLPLDPAYPEERLAFILKDSRASILLTEKQRMRGLPQHDEAQVVCLDTRWEEISRERDENPQGRATASNLAYVIYTSGSTGKPKGVQITHGGGVNLLEAISVRPGLSHGDILLSVTTLSFDIAVVELFLPLAVGARVVLVSRETANDGAELRRKLLTSGATVMQSTPATWQLLLETGWSEENQLKILCGGETLSRELASQLLKRGTSLWNIYGPTETTVYSLLGRVDETEVNQEVISIGNPIANTQVYIVDRQLQPVPVGVLGELHIGGLGLARGYWNRSDQTAERFIPDPFSGVPGARLYRTGDWVRYRPDGKIEFLGRIDHQVKIRGFRIELGEIEAALREHAMVRNAVVAVRGENPGDKYLVGYVIPEEKSVPTTSELRGFLRRTLPDYMIPSVFVALHKLPMTPNGKIDRKALPAPNCDRPDLESSYVAPRNAAEEMIAEIWREVLGVENIGVHDNFFDLGGHSLLAMKLSSKMSTATNRDISVRSLFLYPAIAPLADALMSFPTLTGGPAVKLVPLQHAGETNGREEALQPSSPYLQIEQRSLLSLLGVGKIAPVDAAALGYLPDSILTDTGATRAEVIHDWYEDLPLLSAINEIPMGRIGIILLPRFQSELYHDPADLVERVVEALELARQIGARSLSLTGLIPSATEYGQAIARRVGDRLDLPRITTGHASTAATVVLSVLRILEESGRDLRSERVGFLGLGSIGTTVLRLMLRCLPHPDKIILCDIYSKLSSLESARNRLVDNLDFRGSVKVLGASGGLPQEFYESTLIVGATNVPDVLDIDRLNEGTLLVDDSGPHCFKTEDAFQRFRTREDILFTQGGILQSPYAVTQIRQQPHQARQRLSHLYRKAVTNYNPFHITGCVLSSLLSSCHEDLKPTVGLADDRDSLQHYQKLVALGFRGADLSCGGFLLPQEQIHRFRRSFGAPASNSDLMAKPARLP
jgi:amino acid adenylation domain-containing protein